MKKQCVECGDEFIGRADKKYCSDSCRSTHHNRQHGSNNNFIRNINRILRTNRNILAELNPDGKANIHRNKLVEKGFKFSYFTNQYATRAGRVYKFCYDQGYVENDAGYVTIVVRQEYVE